MLLVPHFTEEETEAQRGKRTVQGQCIKHRILLACHGGPAVGGPALPTFRVPRNSKQSVPFIRKPSNPEPTPQLPSLSSSDGLGHVAPIPNSPGPDARCPGAAPVPQGLLKTFRLGHRKAASPPHWLCLHVDPGAAL